MDENFERLKEELRKLYAAPVQDQRAIVQLEVKVWALWTVEARHRGIPLGPKRVWFKEQFDVSQNAVERRSAIWGFGPWTDPLWELINQSKVTLNGAYKLANLARERGKVQGVEYSHSIRDVINEYLHSGYRGVQDGELEGEEEVASTQPSDVSNPRRFLSALRALLDSFVDPRLNGVDEMVVADFKKDMEHEIRVVYEDALRRIQKLKRLGDITVESVSYANLCRACEFLDLKPPKRGQLVDKEAARRRFRTLAARFHPDRNRGDEKFREQYQAVNEAWSLIQQYNEQLKV